MYTSQQCIMCQGKMVMVLVQLTFMKQLYNSDYYYAKITIHDFKIYLKADLHDATLTHAASLPRAYNMTWDHLHAHDFFQLQN